MVTIAVLLKLGTRTPVTLTIQSKYNSNTNNFLPTLISILTNTYKHGNCNWSPYKHETSNKIIVNIISLSSRA